MAYRDKKDQSTYFKQWYQTHKKDVKARAVRFKRKNRNVLIAYVNEFKIKQGCLDCGNKDFRVLDFDHLPKYEKVDSIGTLVSKSVSLHVVKHEITKCEIRCANCHRIVTWKRRVQVPSVANYNRLTYNLLNCRI